MPLLCKRGSAKPGGIVLNKLHFFKLPGILNFYATTPQSRLRRDRAESQVSATLSVFKNLGRRFPAKTFSRTIVNKIDNIIYSLLRNCTKIETFRKEET